MQKYCTERLPQFHENIGDWYRRWSCALLIGKGKRVEIELWISKVKSCYFIAPIVLISSVIFVFRCPFTGSHICKFVWKCRMWSGYGLMQNKQALRQRIQGGFSASKWLWFVVDEHISQPTLMCSGNQSVLHSPHVQSPPPTIRFPSPPCPSYICPPTHSSHPFLPFFPVVQKYSPG